MTYDTDEERKAGRKASQRTYNAKYRAANREKEAARHDRWRADNPESAKAYIAKYRANVRRFVQLAKWMGSCGHCGGKFPEAEYDFHHTDPSTKAFSIGDYRSHSIPVTKAEMRKCELLCRSCHKKHHSVVQLGA